MKNRCQRSATHQQSRTVDRPTPEPQTYTLRPLTPEECLGRHAPALLGLWQRNLAITETQRLAWLYAQHPQGGPLTWVAETRSGHIIGCASILPLDDKTGSPPTRIGLAIDLAVDAKHRVFGPGRQLQRAVSEAAAAQGFGLILAVPTLEARGLFRRAGFAPLGEQTPWVKLLHLGPWLGQHLPQGLASRLGVGFDALASAWERRQLRAAERFPAQLVITTRCDPRFDALRAWQPALLHPLPNAKTLQWRYADCPMRPHHFYCLVGQGDQRLLAWAAIAHLPRAAVISAWQAEDALTRRVLLWRCVARLRQAQTPLVSLALLGDPTATKLLASLHFLKRRPGRACLLRVDPAQTGISRPAALNPAHWSLLDGDLDL